MITEEEKEIHNACFETEQLVNVYHFLGTQDRHLIRIFHWLKILESLTDEVRESDQDKELEEELLRISGILMDEISIRMWNIMRDRIGK